LHESLELLADSGYQGLSKLHDKSRTPKKRSKNRTLTKAERRANRELSQRRIVVENVIRSLKSFAFFQSVIATEESDSPCVLT
jgi:IS5 family transposase